MKLATRSWGERAPASRARARSLVLLAHLVAGRAVVRRERLARSHRRPAWTRREPQGYARPRARPHHRGSARNGSGIARAPGRVDILLGHSLGALTALKLCGRYGDLAGRLVIEEPPGSENSDFDEVARMVESDVARAREAPEEAKREQLEENPSFLDRRRRHEQRHQPARLRRRTGRRDAAILPALQPVGSGGLDNYYLARLG